MSCTRLVHAHPGSHVVTVFAGGPACVDPLPPGWDALSGVLQAGDDVPAIRRREDETACALVGAVPHHLGFWDEQYRNPTYSYDGPEGEALVSSIAESLIALMDDLPVDAWVTPLGLLHPDHQMTAAASLSAFKEMAARSAGTQWMAYSELPHTVVFPGEVDGALQRLRAAEFVPEMAEVELSGDLARKRATIACHRSQLEMLWSSIDTALLAPETFYRLRQQSPTETD